MPPRDGDKTPHLNPVDSVDRTHHTRSVAKTNTSKVSKVQTIEFWGFSCSLTVVEQQTWKKKPTTTRVCLITFYQHPWFVEMVCRKTLSMQNHDTVL